MEVITNASLVDEESKLKRRASEKEWIANKKRALSSPMADSPVAAATTNGLIEDGHRSQGTRDDDAFPDQEKVLTFRKVAIYRRMLHYRAECEREQRRSRDLEDALRQSQLAKTAADSCWAFTLDSLRNLISNEHWKKASESNGVKLDFPSRVCSAEDLAKAKSTYEEKMRGAQTVVKYFMTLVEKAPRPSFDELHSECAELRKSNAFLAGEADQAYGLLKLVEKERDDYLEELRNSRTQIIRLETNQLLSSLDATTLPKAPLKQEQVSGSEEGNSKERSPEAPVPAVEQKPEEVAEEITQLRNALQARNKLITEYVKKNVELEHEYKTSKSEVTNLSQNTIRNTRLYSTLYDFSKKQSEALEQAGRDIAGLRESLQLQADNRKQAIDEALAISSKEAADAKALIIRKDEDLNRLRQNRDQLDGQVKELKAICESKWSGISRYKELLESRDQKIELMASEIRRLRKRIAASNGDGDLYAFFSNSDDINADYVEDLRTRLKATVDELNNLRSSNESDTLVTDITSLRAELEAARKELEAYRSQGMSDAAKQFQAKEEQLRTAELKLQQSAQEIEDLYIEMDRLSVAWEDSDKALKNELANLTNWEAEKEKLIQAKARSDNKYYKAMSDLDAKESERKSLLAVRERQLQVLSAKSDSEKKLQELILNLQRENKTMHTMLQDHERKSEEAMRTIQEKEIDLKDKTTSFEQLEAEKKKLDNSLAMKELESSQAAEKLEKAQREAERAKEQIKYLSRPAAPASETEEQLQEEIKRREQLLKCSTCHLAYRSVVLSKCSHTFCKSCVDSRIQSRQRRCPHCNLPFAVQDVLQLFMQ